MVVVVEVTVEGAEDVGVGEKVRMRYDVYYEIANEINYTFIRRWWIRKIIDLLY